MQTNIRGIQAAASTNVQEIVADIKNGFDAFVAKHEKTVNALSDRLVELEQRNITVPGFGGVHATRATFGAKAAVEFQKFREQFKAGGRVAFDVNAAIVGKDTGASEGAKTPETPNLDSTFWLADMLPHVPADNSFTLNYMRVTGTTGTAGVQIAEGAQKAQTQPDLQRIAQNLITVAGWCSVSEQALGTEAGLSQLLNTHLRREVSLALDAVLINGNTATGATSPFEGYKSLAKPFASTYTSVRDAIVEAAVALSISGFRADVVVLHPTDYSNILLERDNQSRYQNTEDPFIGLRIALSSNVSIGHPLVLDSQFLSLHMPSSVGVQIAQAGDDFTRNLVTIRAEVNIAPTLYDVRALYQITTA